MSTPAVTRSLYDDRALLRGEDPAMGEEVDGWAELAQTAVRAMNHITGGQPIPAPVPYSLLGNLSGLAHMLPQLCQQLADGLQRSLTEFDVYDDNRSPAQSATEARIALATAEEQVQVLAAALDVAQVAINSQGYNLADAPRELSAADGD
jgi:hypothetical protein